MNAHGSDFQRQIDALRQGEHLCSVYADTREMLGQVVPYLAAGLAGGERCFYVADDHDERCIRASLSESGVDVARAVERRDLVFWTRHNYRQPGAFDIDAMARFINASLDAALADRHAGIRLAVEMTWTVDNGVTDRDLVRWEDVLNTISHPGSKVSFICQYNSSRLPAELIRRAVHVHPVVVLGTQVCPNLHHMPSAVVLDETSNGDGLHWLLEQLRQQRASHDIPGTIRREFERLIEERTRALASANDALRAEIGERKRVESALQRSREQLEEKVRDLEAFHDVVVGRELRMMDLEHAVARLQSEVQRLKGPSAA